MKKLMYIFAVLGIVSLSACEKNGPGSGNENTITNIEVPATAEIGASVTVRGEGFDAATAKLLLADAAGKETAVESPKFSAMGVSFVVPTSLKPGLHTLYCEQNGKFELGKIELKASGLPVTGLKCPEGTAPGYEMTIEGAGFPEDCKVAVEDSKGTRTELPVTDRANGLKVSVPAEIVSGEYRLILTSGNIEWTLVEKFIVYKAKSIKAVSQEMSVPEQMDVVTKWEVNKTGAEVTGLISSQSMSMPGSEPLAGAVTYSINKQGDSYDFTPDAEGDEANMPFSLTIKDGKVISNTISRGSKNDEYKWSYTAEGHVEKLYKSTPDKPYISFIYENGVLTEYSGSLGASFNHADAKVMSNPCAPDVTKVMMFFDGNFENFQVVANLLGWDGINTNSYPVVIVGMDYEGNPVNYNISYQFDADGYVTEMSWIDEGQGINMSIKFEYFE